MLTAPDLSLVYIMVLFGVAFFIVKHLYVMPLVRIIDERKSIAASADEAHEQALRHSRETILGTEERLGEVRRQAVRRRETLREEGRKVREEKLGVARKSAEQVMTAEREKLAAEIPALRQKVAADAELIAGEVVTKILGKR